jgi:hypothetical protein
MGWLASLSNLLFCIGFSTLLACSAALNAQSGSPSPSAGATFQRQDGTDAGTGVRYVRLLLALPAAGEDARPARFTVECVEDRGKRDLLWFVSFGGIDDPGFLAPFRATQGALFPPQYPTVNLKMTFEGYIKSKPFTRAWSVLPSGALRYRNPGTDSPNMDSTRYFLTFLNSLPGLRIGYAKSAKSSAAKPLAEEVFFPTQPLLDELKKTPLCSP